MFLKRECVPQEAITLYSCLNHHCFQSDILSHLSSIIEAALIIVTRLCHILHTHLGSQLRELDSG